MRLAVGFRYLAFVVVFLSAVAGGWLLRSCVQGNPLYAAPGSGVTDGVMTTLPGIPAPSLVWLWTPSNVFMNRLGDTSTVEVRAPGGSSIAGVLGMNGDKAESPTVFLWNESHLYIHFAGPSFTGISGTTEVTRPNGAAIAGVRGIDGGSRLVWTATNVLALRGSKAAEVTGPGGAAIPGVLGLVTGSGGPTYLWNATNVYLLLTGDRVAEVLAPDGASIAMTKGIVVTEAGTAYIWTASKVLALTPPLVRTRELKAPDGTASIAGVKGIVVDEATGAGADGILLWNAASVYRKLSGQPAPVELLTPSGAPIAGVRGVVGPRSSGPRISLGSIIWNATNVYRELSGERRTVELTAPDGSSITDVLGVTTEAALGEEPEAVYMWNPDHLYKLVILSARGVREVTDPAGGPVAGVRGVIAGEEDVVWSATGVYRIATLAAQELTRPNGTSLGGAWGVVASPSLPGLGLLVRTDTGAFVPSLRGAAEIKAPNGASIGSAANPRLAMVNNVALHSGAIGVGSANAPAPLSVRFVGSARSSADVPVGAAAGLTTVTAQGPGFQIVTSDGVAAQTAPSSMLLLSAAGAPTPTPTPPLPVGGIAQLPDVAQAPARQSASSSSSDPPYAALASGLGAAVAALSAGAWYARRRWLH